METETPRDPSLDFVLEVGGWQSFPGATVLCWWIRGVRDRGEPFATSRLRTPKRLRLLWQPGQLRCVRRAGRRPPHPSFLAALRARPGRCGARGWGVCRYHGKGALGGHILPQGGSAPGIREGGGDGGGIKGRREGQNEGGVSDKTLQGFWGWDGEFGICPRHPQISGDVPVLPPHSRWGSSP